MVLQIPTAIPTDSRIASLPYLCVGSSFAIYSFSGYGQDFDNRMD